MISDGPGHRTEKKWYLQLWLYSPNAVCSFYPSKTQQVLSFLQKPTWNIIPLFDFFLSSIHLILGYTDEELLFCNQTVFYTTPSNVSPKFGNFQKRQMTSAKHKEGWWSLLHSSPNAFACPGHIINIDFTKQKHNL